MTSDVEPENVQDQSPKQDTGLAHRHLLGLEGWSRGDIGRVLDTAVQFREVLDRPIRSVPSLRGVTVVNLFYEPSTRTRISFELAEKRLSADVVNFSSSGSSISKGETLRDTARNIEAMKIDMVIIRHGSAGAPSFLTRCVDAVVINAGDGAHEHPTQALLDALTIREQFGRIEGLRISIIGDIMHSRVARSNLHALTTLGADVTICGPASLLPVHLDRLLGERARGRVRVTTCLDEALDGCDVAMALRIQMERQGRSLFPSVREYHEQFGIRMEHMEAHRDLIVMHPGPVNRGVELATDVVDHERALILNQVTNGVAVRMSVLYLMADGTKRHA